MILTKINTISSFLKFKQFMKLKKSKVIGSHEVLDGNKKEGVFTLVYYGKDQLVFCSEEYKDQDKGTELSNLFYSIEPVVFNSIKLENKEVIID